MFKHTKRRPFSDIEFGDNVKSRSEDSGSRKADSHQLLLAPRTTANEPHSLLPSRTLAVLNLLSQNPGHDVLRLVVNNSVALSFQLQSRLTAETGSDLFPCELDHPRRTTSMPNAACWRCCSWIPAASPKRLRREPADFAGEANRTIYEAMLRLHSAGKPVDVTLLVGELRDRGQYGAEAAFRRRRWSSCFGRHRGSRTAAVPFPCFGNLPPTLFAGRVNRLGRWASAIRRPPVDAVDIRTR